MYNWDEIINEFAVDIQIKGFAKSTIQNYHYKLKKSKLYFEEQGINKNDNLTKQDIKEYIAQLQQDGLQSSTINSIINKLIKLFDYMVDEEYIKTNPCSKIKRLKQQNKIIYPLDDNEIRQLLAIASKNRYKYLGQRNLTIFAMMLECGLRVSEVVNLKNDDILENQIIIRNSKGNKDRALAITPILKKQLKKYDRIKNSRYQDNCEYYFISYFCGKIDIKAVYEAMQTIKKQAFIRKVVRFSPHTLRHTYAYMQIRNGMDIYTLSKNMGHTSVVMTQNYLQTLKSDDFVEESVKYSTLMNLK
jgi:integrase/recombinase XerD